MVGSVAGDNDRTLTSQFAVGPVGPEKDGSGIRLHFGTCVQRLGALTMTMRSQPNGRRHPGDSAAATVEVSTCVPAVSNAEGAMPCRDGCSGGWSLVPS